MGGLMGHGPFDVRLFLGVNIFGSGDGKGGVKFIVEFWLYLRSRVVLRGVKLECGYVADGERDLRLYTELH